MMSKKCNSCGQTKSLDEYYVRRKGRQSGSAVQPCKHCSKLRVKSYKEKNKDVCRERDRKYYQKNKKKIAAKTKLYYQNNKEVKLTYAKDYYRTNKESIKQYYRSWAKLNKYKINAINKRYKTAKVKAAPSWLTEDHMRSMEEFYWLAQDLKRVTGEDYHVDHIVPLQGENVCGLHVPWNLQILPSDLNVRKSNRHG